MKTLKITAGRTLRNERLSPNPKLSMEQVANCYRGGVSRQRISQIESAKSLRKEIIDAYRAAISAALAERARANAILDALCTADDFENRKIPVSGGCR